MSTPLPPSHLARACAACALDEARRRLTGRARPVPPARHRRLARRVLAGTGAAALSVGALAVGASLLGPDAPARLDAVTSSADLLPPVEVAAAAEEAPTGGAPTPSTEPSPPTVALAPVEPGYHLVSTNGDVAAFGSARFVGGALDAPAPVTGTARHPGGGYWQVASDGGVFSFGGAPFLGSAGGAPLVAPVTAMAATPAGDGYWLAAEDGGVFAFGAAPWLGSASAAPLNAPIVDVAATPTGRGYWLVGADGGVFAFGDAADVGSLAATPLGSPVVAAAPSASGWGLVLTSADGGVFALGDAPFEGSAVGSGATAPVVDVALSPAGAGYWLVAADGGVFAFGDAPFLGSVSDRRKLAPVIGIDGGLGTAKAPTTELSTRYGHDISWPQCGGAFPDLPYGHAIVGVTGGRPFTANRCLADQHRWSLAGGSGAGLYVNLAYPKADAAEAVDGPRGRCADDDRRCRAYTYGANTVRHALEVARAAGASAPLWWLDVEVANHWSSDLGANQDVVLGAVEALQAAGVEVGVYSTPRMWQRITGGMQLGLPVWVAGAPSDEAAPRWCRPDRAFGGGEVWLVQSLPIRYDVNWACDPVAADPAQVFRFER